MMLRPLAVLPTRLKLDRRAKHTQNLELAFDIELDRIELGNKNARIVERVKRHKVGEGAST